MEPKSIKKPFKIDTEIDAKNDAVGWGSRSRTSIYGRGLGGGLIRVTRRRATPRQASRSPGHASRGEARGESRGGTKGEGEGEEATAQSRRPAQERGGGSIFH